MSYLLFVVKGATSCGLGQIPAQTSDISQQLLTFTCSDGTIMSYENMVYGFGKRLVFFI